MVETHPDGAVTLEVLGLLEVRRAGQWIIVPAGLARRALLALVLARHRGLSDRELIDRLWGDTATATALASLRNTVNRLRSRIGADVIERTTHGYRIDVSRVVLDVDEFDSRVSVAQQHAADGALDKAATSARRALRLVRSHPYLDVADEWWAATPAGDVAERIAVAEELWAGLVLRLGRSQSEIGRLRRAAHSHPDRELRWKQLVEALITADRRVDAVRAVHDARRALAEHGLDVSRDLRALEASALADSDR